MVNYEELKVKELQKIRTNLEIIARALQPIARAYEDINDIEEEIALQEYQEKVIRTINEENKEEN